MVWYYDFNCMPYGSSESVSCLACDSAFPHYKKLSEHIKKEHRLEPDSYYVNYLLGGVRPKCTVCEQEPRYVSLSKGFKKNCIQHAKLAMSIGGSQGGASPAWNKGKTKETDDRLARQSEAMKGIGNPFFGKKHSDSTKQKNAAAHRLDRFTFRAQSGKSEVEVAKSEGVRTVWGSGNKVYVWRP